LIFVTAGDAIYLAALLAWPDGSAEADTIGTQWQPRNGAPPATIR
jgi:hypothetical protein